DWLLDHRAHAGPEHFFGRVRRRHGRQAGFDPGPELALRVSFGLGRDSTWSTWWGAGKLALAAAPGCRRVIAVDPSPAMTGAIIRSVVATEIANVEVGRAAFSRCQTSCSSASPRR